jgi:hypothetical protein
MTRRAVLLSIVLAGALPAQKYTGPRPAKPDVPYLLHADTLVETESAEAKEEAKKDDILYVVAGANSPVKTPLASPILLLQSEKLQADRLQLFKLESRNGRREILFSRKKKQTAKPLMLEVKRLAEGLFRVEVDQSLENGEYSLTPEGSNQVFCFSVY